MAANGTPQEAAIRERFRALLIEQRERLLLSDGDIALYTDALAFLGIEKPTVVQIIGPNVSDDIMNLARRAAHEVMKEFMSERKRFLPLTIEPGLLRSFFLDAVRSDDQRRRLLFAAFLGGYFEPTTASVIAGTTPWDSLDADHQRRIEEEIQRMTRSETPSGDTASE